MRVTSGFGHRQDPLTRKLAFHSGVDLAAANGSKIYPVRDGAVTFAGWKEGYGRVVIVQHKDGLQSVYAHNRANLVKAGQRVTQDTPIGEVGSSGRCTGAHVHVEVRKNGKPINPMPYLGKELLARNG
jgi:murein DD-endopeptidase MepM/ murein hydrolase activator NlpD